MAHQLYRSALLLSGFLTLPLLTVAQQFQNLQFEESLTSSETGLQHWAKSWGSDSSCTAARYGGSVALRIRGEAENSVGFVEQSVSVSPLEIEYVLKVSADIATELVDGKGAGINVGVYGAKGNLLANADMGGFNSISWRKGDNTKTRIDLTAVCPEGTSEIRLGAILYGSGTAYFDDFEVTFESVADRVASPLAIEYVNAMSKIIQEHSLIRDKVNYQTLIAAAGKVAGNATTAEECYPAIRFMLESLRPLGDNHSHFMTRDEVLNWSHNEEAKGHIEFPRCEHMANMGYIYVPPFHGGNPDLMQQYADSLQSGIADLASKDVQGWIVDLRENTGGNMEPMIIGLGPLFDEEKLGSLLDVHGKSESWYYSNGQYHWDGENGMAASNPIKLDKILPTAVLTSGLTGSSGEAIAISFIGGEHTRSFGQPTWGLTTGNSEFELPDKSRIYLSATRMADRTGKIYDAEIPPDVAVPEGADIDALQTAINWLSSQ